MGFRVWVPTGVRALLFAVYGRDRLNVHCEPVSLDPTGVNTDVRGHAVASDMAAAESQNQAGGCGGADAYNGLVSGGEGGEGERATACRSRTTRRRRATTLDR